MTHIQPTSYVQALWNELAALPYAASLGHAALHPETIGDVADTVSALAAVLRSHAERCNARDAELDQLRHDLRAVRRVFGAVQA